MYEDLVKALRELAEDDNDEAAQAADAIEDLEKLTDAQLDIIKQYQVYLTKQQWISVTERLPEPRSVVLAYSKTLFTVIAYYTDNCEWSIPNPEIFYWMPLPVPPKEVDT